MGRRTLLKIECDLCPTMIVSGKYCRNCLKLRFRGEKYAKTKTIVKIKPKWEVLNSLDYKIKYGK